MRPQLRRKRIVDLVRARERVTVDTLAAALNTSRETIRRDLADLSDQGLVRKFHGGASLPETAHEGSFAARMKEAPAEKRRIARAAAALFEPGQTLFIDTGTTTLLFAEELTQRSGLTVVTNCLGIAQRLGRAGTAHRVFVLGGAYEGEADENVGPLTVEQVAGYSTDHAVLTVGALGPEGASDFNVEEARVAQAMIARAREVTVIADGSKFGRMALFRICDLDQIARIVTDAPPEPVFADVLRQAGVELVLAG